MDKGEYFSNLFGKRGRILYKSFNQAASLPLSYLMNNLSLQLDRIMLKLFVSYSAVSEYYVVSLIGKSLVFFGFTNQCADIILSVQK